MKRGKQREEFIEYLKIYLPFLLNDKKALDEVSTHLENLHGISKGTLLGIIGKEKVLADQDIAFLALLGEQISQKVPTVGGDLDLDNWFNEHQIKTFRNYVHAEDDMNDRVEGDLVFENVEYLGDGYYGAFVKKEMIAQLRKHHRIDYDFESQREAKNVRVRGEYIPVIKLNWKNIQEMKELIKEGNLTNTPLVYNCTFGSTDDSSGIDMHYNEKTRRLTITEGTQVTYTDGTHRTTAYYEVYKEQGYLDGSVMVYFTNFTPAKAREYQVQLAKQTPISKDRLEIMDDTSLSNELVTKLNEAGELKNQIDNSSEARLRKGFIVKHTDLMRGFDIYWKPSNNRDIHTIMNIINEYMSNYFNYVYSKDEEFLKERVLFNEKLFAFNIYLAKTLKEKEIPFTELERIFNNYNLEDNERIAEIRKKIAMYKTTKKPYLELANFVDELIER